MSDLSNYSLKKITYIINEVEKKMVWPITMVSPFALNISPEN